MRLIDADALMRELKHRSDEAAEARMTLIAEDFIELVRDADVVEVPRWIPVTERLPEPDDLVLTYCPGRKETPSEVVMRGWAAMIHATHWMPLPSAPEVE